MIVLGRLFEDDPRDGASEILIVANRLVPELRAWRWRRYPHLAGRIFGESLMYATDNMGIGLRSA